MRSFLYAVFFLLLQASLNGSPLYSPSWGFRLDLPEGYQYAEGNGKDRFSFLGPDNLQFDIRVYNGEYASIEELAADVNRRLGNRGDTDFFMYREKNAAIISLNTETFNGWSLCIELEGKNDDVPRPMLVALSYSTVYNPSADFFHISALDSIVPSEADRRYPGPIMEYAYPRGEQRETALAKEGINALIREGDAEAAQELVDREFSLLCLYLDSDYWQEAWIRYYRAIFRDSWDRVSDAVFKLERKWNVWQDFGIDRNSSNKGVASERGVADRAFAEKALAFVQGFEYERNFEGSDFVNLVSAVTEGRGDCDTRAVLWAMILSNANIPAAIMVSRNHSHAMGLAVLTGSGARFKAAGTEWMVAETTAPVNIGLIAQDVSDVGSWLAVIFESE